MIRPVVRGCLLLFALLALVAGAADAAESPGPRFVFVEYGENPELAEIRTLGIGKYDPGSIVGGRPNHVDTFPYFLDTPSWSSDGTRLAFSGIGGVGARRGQSIFVVGADGTDLRLVPGTRGGIGPVFSPDGRSIAFSRTKDWGPETKPGEGHGKHSAATWVADLVTGATRRLTPLRNGLETQPTSFSPDGRSLLLTRKKNEKAKAEILSLDVVTGSSRPLDVRGAGDAVYSPDGGEIAYLREQDSPFRQNGKKSPTTGFETTTDLYVMRADGTDSRRITNTRRGVELWPSWDPSGQRLSFTRFANLGFEETFPGFGDSIVEVNADGTCQGELLIGDPERAYYGGAWQPGPGREAGRIAC